MRVKKSKTINILDGKLVKNSDIIKLTNFNTAENNVPGHLNSYKTCSNTCLK